MKIMPPISAVRKIARGITRSASLVSSDRLLMPSKPVKEKHRIAKQWLAENDISEKSYYYWLRKIRREVCEQEGLQEVTNPSALSFVEIPVKTALDTTPVPTVPAAMTPVAVIGSGRLTLELSNDISESLLCRLLQ